MKKFAVINEHNFRAKFESLEAAKLVRIARIKEGANPNWIAVQELRADGSWCTLQV